MKYISTVVVTFNRKQALLECLKAVENQSVKPQSVYIYDNASTDGTEAMLKELGYINQTVCGIDFHYIRSQKNIGGSGGFYTGMKVAHEAGCDAIWVMDDDGIPDKDCLKNMISCLGQYDYISPLVIDVENEEMMSFEGCTVAEFLKREDNGIVKGCANPFNGILYSKKLLDTIGYPKKEMFIWGDEINYDNRARQAGFQPVMVTNAIHRHPLNRQRYVKYFGKHMMVVPEQDWKLFCYVRNSIYNTKTFRGSSACRKQMFLFLLKFGLYYTLQEWQPRKLSVVFSAIRKGIRGDFSDLEKYMKQ